MNTISMDSVLTEYNRLIDSLEKQLNVYKSEQKGLKLKVLKLLEHNKRITDHLKVAVEIGIIDNYYSGSLSDELQAAAKSRTEFTDVLLKEVNKPYNGESGVSGIIDMNKIEKHIAEIKDHYTKGLRVLSHEYSDIKNRLSSVKKECSDREKQLEFCRSSLEKAEDTVKCKEKCIINLTSVIQELKKKVLGMETCLLDKDKLLETLEIKNSSLKKHEAELQDVVHQLTEKVSHLEHQKSIFEAKAKKSFLDAQSTMLQMKAFAYKEQLALTFIDDLKLSVSQKMEHKNFTCKHKVKTMVKEYESKVLELVEEVKSLQLENNEKQSLFEKAVREKSSIESKLRATTSGSYPLVSLVVLEDLHKKLSQAEKSKDEALLRIQSLENSLRDMQQSKVKEIDFLKAEANELRKKLQIGKKDLNEALRDRFQHIDQTVKLKKKYSEMEKQLHLLEMQQEKEISLVKQSARQQCETLENQMQIKEEQYKKNITHLHQVLKMQYIINSKWKNALQELTVKSEMKIRELVHDMAHLQQQHKN